METMLHCGKEARLPFMDLHALLPPQLQGSGEFSHARGIDSADNIVGWAADIHSGEARAVIWRPVPEPATFWEISVFVILSLRRGRSR
ncbi:MAG: hypothetical protein H0W86_00950 [Armatimonadetes bacterium]|nr:hypothetical protein [Armatimonadota bacterium]